jgi:hypothetical protein
MLEPASEREYSNPKSSSQKLSTCRTRQSQNILLNILQAASSIVCWLRDFSAEDPTKVIQKRRLRTENHRIADILRVDGQPKAGHEDRLFKAIAQLSLGRDFTLFQKETGPKTRVDELCECLCSSDPEIRARVNSRSNAVKIYLEDPQFAAEDKPILQRAINAGVKLLVIKEMFKKRLQELGKPGFADAISAFMSLNTYAFSHLRYDKLPDLINLLLPLDPNAEAPTIQLNLVTTDQGERESSEVEVTDALVGLSKWFGELQDAYDSKSLRLALVTI